MTKEERNELEAMSFIAFGIKSRWKTLWKKGREIILKDATGRPYRKRIYLSLEDVKKMMVIAIEEQRKDEGNKEG